MNDTTLPIVDPKDLAKLVEVNPKAVDQLVEAYGGVHREHLTLTRLADHYKLVPKDVQQMLVSRQISLLHLLTDYSIPGNPGDFQKLLNTQNTQLDTLMKRAVEQLNQLATALAQAKFMRVEATRVLAAQQMELARFDQEAAVKSSEPNAA